MAPTELTQMLFGILGTILSGGLVKVFLDWRTTRRKEPIEAKTAEIANAKTLSDAALAMVADMREDRDRQDQRIATLEQRDRERECREQQDRERIANLEGFAMRVGSWYQKLVADWPYYRQQDQPPPIPEQYPTPPRNP